MSDNNILPKTIFFFILLSVSCNSFRSDKEYAFLNNLEYSYVWTDNHPSNIVKDEYAKSGQFVCRLDEQNPYSPTFNIRLDELSEKFKVSKVVVSAWLRSDSLRVSPLIILEYRDAARNVSNVENKQITMTALNSGEWALYEYEFKADSSFTASRDNYIRVFLMNNTKSAVFCDDMTVTLK